MSLIFQDYILMYFEGKQAMFSKPEEVIMACLAAFWTVLTYVAVRFTGDWTTVLMVTGCTAVWAVVVFLLWQAGRLGKLYPFAWGGLVACWWAVLDWFALRGVAVPAGEVVVLSKPWYASWWLKLTLMALPIVVGYVRMWRKSQRPKF